MNAQFRLLPLVASLLLCTAAHAADPGDGSQSEPVGITLSLDVTLDLDAAATRAESDIWQRVRSGLVLPELDSPLVEKQQAWFLDRPDYLDTAFKRARLYLFHIVENIAARGMPMEIALLPAIESAYNPHARSGSNASGIWQFIPATGRVYGLKQNDWYDGRQDIVTATDAALDYLEALHGKFGDWELALAAYNCGEGCVSRAITRNHARGLPTDYASLDLAPETRNYVPRLIALRNLVRDADHYGIRLTSIPNRPYFRHVTLPYPIEARTAARLAGIDLDELLDLNPGYRRHVVHVESQDSLLLPADRLVAFQANLDAEESHRIRLRSHIVNKGELLAGIADRFDVTVQWLKDHNPLSVKSGKMARTQTILLPPTVAQGARGLHQARNTARPTLQTHTVRRGETLFALAKRYRVPVAELRELNGAVDVLHPGEKIQIPVDS